MPQEHLPDFHKDPEMITILKECGEMVVRRAYANMCAGRVEDEAMEQLIVAAREIQAGARKLEEELKQQAVAVELLTLAVRSKDAPREE